MKDFLRPLLPQWVINNFWHLPRAILANIFYGFPTRGMKVIGVTGTDGKTTTINMIYQILKEAGKKVSMVSTVNAPGFHVTSPDSFIIQKFARDAVRSKDEYLVLEVTSHALDQYRFWGINFDIGVITNITHEHLDYHQTFENYFNTKLKLIKDARYAVVNENLKVQTHGKLITFGLQKGDLNQRDAKLRLKIPGDFNLENALAAMAVAFVLNIDKNSAQKTLENFTSVNGRMEEVKNSKGIKIFIDFAHTPHALEQALKTLKKPNGRLIAVFGSAGKRDIAKRFLMGEVAGKLTDLVVITAEDPRGNLEIINKQISLGLEKMGAVKGINYFIVEDRAKAIDLAINQLAKREDVVGIFGKGHELSMNLDGKKEIPWSDKLAVNKALENG